MGEDGWQRGLAGPRGFRHCHYFAVFILSKENTKSCLSSGMWQVKQFFRLALSLTVLSALNAWYSHSPLRTSAGYSRAPAVALLHYGVADQIGPLMKRPLASFSGCPAVISLALYCTSVSTVPLGIGLPAFTASIASGVE